MKYYKNINLTSSEKLKKDMTQERLSAVKSLFLCGVENVFIRLKRDGHSLQH